MGVMAERDLMKCRSHITKQQKDEPKQDSSHRNKYFEVSCLFILFKNDDEQSHEKSSISCRRKICEATEVNGIG
jgi:hypothetical protein